MKYDNLKNLRESLGMTQEDFAASLDINKTTYNNYENGTRDPKSTFWKQVANKYHVTIDYLLGLVSEPNFYRVREEKMTVMECKSKFVEKYLRPLVIFANPEVEDVKYEEDKENGDEYVLVSYINHSKLRVDVTADSLNALARDVLYRIN